jgi:AraC family ethanolamine operon transcriptional activator
METETKPEAYSSDCALAVSQHAIIDRSYDDFDAQSERLTGHDQEYFQISAGAFSGRFVSAFLGRHTSLHLETANQMLEQRVSCNKDQLSFGLVLDKGKTFTANGLSLDAGKIMIARCGAELNLDSPADGTIAAICIDRTKLLESCADPEVLDLLLGESSSVDVIKAPALADQMRQNLSSALRAADQARSEQDLETLEDAYLSALSAQFSFHQATRRCWNKTSISRQSTVIMAAKSRMRISHDKGLNYKDLSHRLGYTPRSIQNAFATGATLNPSQYLRAVKLNRCRKEILNAEPGSESIGDIAARHGFWSWSRFSQQYRQLFGELPSETKSGGRTRSN